MWWPTVDFLILLIALIFFFAAGYYVYRLQAQRDERKKLLFIADTVDDPADIKMLLEAAAEQKIRLRIKLNGRRRAYASSLLAITPPALLIDALFPEEGNDLIAYCSFIQADFVIKGTEHDRLQIPYTFTSAYVQAEEFNGYPALHILLPEFIMRDQKRKYLRIRPHVAEPLFVDFVIDGSSMREKIDSISGGGVCFYTNLKNSALFSGRAIEAATIELPGYACVKCSIIIRKHRQNEQPVFIEGKPVNFYCGAEFAGLDSAAREKIIHYVVAKERIELKRLSREFE